MCSIFITYKLLAHGIAFQVETKTKTNRINGLEWKHLHIENSWDVVNIVWTMQKSDPFLYLEILIKIVFNVHLYRIFKANNYEKKRETTTILQNYSMRYYSWHVTYLIHHIQISKYDCLNEKKDTLFRKWIVNFRLLLHARSCWLFWVIC